LRDLQEALYVLWGGVLSRSAVNQITLNVESHMTTWRETPLTETPPVLLVDGVWVQVLYPTGTTWEDQSGHTRQQVRGQERVILAVLAVWPAGRHYLLHYEVAATEDATTWATLFQHLKTRGLDPQAVQVVTSDGSKGLLEALAAELPTAHQQRCTVHKVRGLARYLTFQDLPAQAAAGQPLTPAQARHQRMTAISQAAAAVFAAPTRPEAEARLAAFVAAWTPVEPAAVHNFTWGLTRCFTFYQLPAALQRLARSTNLLERFFREFRNKADEIGAFPNETSCHTLFYLVMLREHAKHDRYDFAKTT